MLKKLLAVSAAMLLTLASYVAAVELRDDHPDTYVVQKGDTLWDIAARFLNEPWLWPEIWQANPQVENPHLIYPGDVLSLAYLGERGPVVRLSPSARRTGKPVDALPLSEIEPFLRKAHVLDPDAYKSMPYIVGLEESRLRSAEGQLVYARNGQFAPGQTWAIVRPTLAYSSHVHRRSRGAELKREPWNSTTGREGRNEGFEWAYHVPESHPRYVLGYEVLEVTQAVVTREGDPATLLITPGGREAKVGDLLMPYDPQPYDLTFYPRAMDAIPADMRILAQTDRLLYGGPRDVVALSAGAADGVENGHVFAIYRPGELVEDRVAVKQPINRKLRKNKVQLPDEFVGHVMVFRTFDRISYGLIMDGVRAVRLDDKLKSPERR